jgi:hypothetical protein
MHTIPKQEWLSIPEQAQQEVYNFFLFTKQKLKSEHKQDDSETLAFSNHSANLIEDWKNEDEDSVWK